MMVCLRSTACTPNCSERRPRDERAYVVRMRRLLVDRYRRSLWGRRTQIEDEEYGANASQPSIGNLNRSAAVACRRQAKACFQSGAGKRYFPAGGDLA